LQGLGSSKDGILDLFKLATSHQAGQVLTPTIQNFTPSCKRQSTTNTSHEQKRDHFKAGVYLWLIWTATLKPGGHQMVGSAVETT
jgi:hypothetical protein